MLLIYSIIILLILALAGISIFCLNSIRRSSAAYLNQQETITRLKMESIRSRMSPHFIFNALSGLSAETDNPATIKSKIDTLLMLLRSSVDNIEQTAIPLSEELELVKGYVSLQSHRVPEPFAVNFDIGEGTNMNQLIPAMILQIPVENALKHGLIPLSGEKLLSIKIGTTSRGLQLLVEDNGVGYGSSGNRSSGAGTGLRTLFQLIALLNSKNTNQLTFTIKDLNSGENSRKGTLAEIVIPDEFTFDLF